MANTETAVAMMSSMSPVFGPEIGTFMRMWYGTQDNRFAGITPGRFYDFRAFPVPYTPLLETTFQLDHALNDGSLVHVKIIRENPAPAGVTDELYAVVTAPVTIFGARLSQGLNTLVASINGVDVAQTSVTAVTVATHVYHMALNIYNGFWAKLNAIESDILSVEPTLLTAPLLRFDNLFSTAANLNRMARGLSVNALMNMPGSSQAVKALSQATLFQTPVLSRTRSQLSRAWLRGLQSQAFAVNGSTMHVWGPNPWAGRYATAVALAKRDGAATGRDFVGDRATGDFTNLNDGVDIEFEPRRSWLSLADSSDVSDLEFTAHSCPHGQIQSPGLLDSAMMHFDTGIAMDNGRLFDEFGRLGDPAPNMYVGVPITPMRMFAEPTLPMSTLDKVIDAFAISLEIHGIASFDDVFTTGQDVDTTTTDSGWSLRTYAPNYVTESPDVASDPGVLIGLDDLGPAGHKHKGVLLTAAQRASVKSGMPVIVTSQRSDNIGSKKHSHRLRISWYNGYIVEVDSNHGHYATAAEFNENGVP
jgi:hypothetical protein